MFTDYTVSAEVTKDGRLELADRPAFSRAMKHFKRGRVTVRVEIDRGKRSNQANRYYRLVLGLISDETGHDVDELHEYYKHKYGTPRTVTLMGKDIEIWTTTQDDPEKFFQYVEDVRRHALIDLHVETPDPDPALRGKPRKSTRKVAQATMRREKGQAA